MALGLDFYARTRVQFGTLAAMTAAVLLATLILMASGSPAFERFIGSVNPLFALVGVSLIMAALTHVGLRADVFKICGKETLTGILLSSGIASFFGLIVIGADTMIIFPRGMNVPFPDSLLFYPVIGYGIEILFHALPLLVAAFVITELANRPGLMWLGIAVVATIEPVLQTWTSYADGHPIQVVAFVFAQVFAINVCQLAIFRRYDFVSMYALRLVYYLFWHIGWGHFRLKILF
jgi:hypothetical protein